MPMGANFGDMDNDGFLDIYLGTGNPSYASLLPNVLLRNKEGKSFVDVTASSGTGELHKGHGVAFADLDNDGDEEIVAEIGGATPGDSHPLRLFENPGHGRDWLSLRLVGVKTNRAAIGARITLTVDNDGRGTRSIHRIVGSGGSFGASPLEQHIGLGKSARIVELEIWWPVSNTRQRVTGLGTNQAVEITELAKSYTAIERRPMTLGRKQGGEMRRLLATALVLLAIPSSQAAQEYPVTGMVLKVDRARLTFTASIQAIPGFMAAMAMPFEVRQAQRPRRPGARSLRRVRARRQRELVIRRAHPRRPLSKH